MKGEREVAGLRCGDVLIRLSDYLDDDLSSAEREQVEAHLVGCDTCERFGGEMAETVAALRRRLVSTPPSGVLERLHARLRRETEDE